MATAPKKICDHPKFEAADFSERWKRARISAMQSVLQVADTFDPMKPPQVESEMSLLKRIPILQQSDVLRRVFDFSRKFGVSASRHFGVTLEISDLTEISPSLASPCFHGVWKKHNSAVVLARTGCEEVKTLGQFACDYWREAFDGLVMGVGENERLARHRSVGHGDADCLDILYTEDFTLPRVADAASSSPKYGTIPGLFLEALNPTAREFEKQKIKLVLEGFSEGVLYYRLKPAVGVLCGAAGNLFHASFVKKCNDLFPNLKLQDVEPQAVYGGPT